MSRGRQAMICMLVVVMSGWEATEVTAQPAPDDPPPVASPEDATAPRDTLASLERWRELMAGEVTELDALLVEGAAAHPSVELSRARAEVARARSEVVDTLPDPTLRVSVVGLPWTRWTLDETPMSGVELSLGWMFPWPGSLEARSQVQLAEAEALESTTGEAALEVELEASQLYWSVYRVDRTLETLDAVEAVLADMQRLAEARYRYGTTREADILQVGLELTRLDERRLALLASRAELVARFDALLERPDGATLVPPKGLDIEPLSADDADTLLAGALERRPMFETLDERLEVIDTRAEAAEYEAFPDLSVGASYRFRLDSGMDPVDGEDFLGFSVGVTLPFASAGKVDDELAMLERERTVVEVERAVAERRLEVAIESSVARLEELESQIEFARETLLDESRAALDTLIAVYPTGGADFLDLLQAERRIVEIEVTLHQLVADHRRLRDQLERLAGAPVSLVHPF